ncbi:MAG: hypothetical protein M0Q15_05945 [Nevskia sp.]|nr:hypothetical protein [Nevskia sp.]
MRDVHVEHDLIEDVERISCGVPIYLEYLANILNGQTKFDQKKYLSTLPTLRDDKIDRYHEHLWELCSKDDVSVYILAFLALRQEFTSPAILVELLKLAGVTATTLSVHNSLAALRHVLRISDAKSVAIRHSSLEEYVSERTSSLRDDLNKAIVTWYTENPGTDEAWRHYFRHLRQLGETQELLRSCNDEWVNKAWAHYRPMAEIQRNLDIAWEAASSEHDFVEFIRIGLLKQRVALATQNLGDSEEHIAEVILDIGRSGEALRRVWDGERPECGRHDFAKFSLHYVASTGHSLPEHILRTGLGEEFSGSPAEFRTWLMARSYVADPVDLVISIEDTDWAGDSNDDDNSLLEGARGPKLDIQLAVIQQLAESRRLSALQNISGNTAIRPLIRQSANLASSCLYRAADHNFDISTQVQASDFNKLPRYFQRWAVLKLASIPAPDATAALPIAKPRLPAQFLNEQGNELNPALFILFDELRALCFLDDLALPWIEAHIGSLDGPLPILIRCLGRVARLWAAFRKQSNVSSWALRELKEVAFALDLQSSQFESLGSRDELAKLYYKRHTTKFFEPVWRVAAMILDAEDLSGLGTWWLALEGGLKARRHPGATRRFAAIAHQKLAPYHSGVTHQILVQAEQNARADEETSELAAELLACARAWGQSGFQDEAQRLWQELLIVACGLGWRKDYQFNSIIDPLQLASAADPEHIVDRLQEQLELIHQLIGTAQGKTTAVAIEGLTEWLTPLNHSLALRMIEKEEDYIYRERALRDLIRALIDTGHADLRLLLSLVATMSKWRDYTDFDEQTRPALFEVYEAAIKQADYDVAQSTYDFARHVLLVEKEQPGEVGRWAHYWTEHGNAPASVIADLSLIVPPKDKEQSGIHETIGEETDLSMAQKADVDAFAGAGPEAIDALLDALSMKSAVRERLRQLRSVHSDWLHTLAKLAKLRLSEDLTSDFDKSFEHLGEELESALESNDGAIRTKIKEYVAAFIGHVLKKASGHVDFPEFDRTCDLDGWLDSYLGSTSMYEVRRFVEDNIGDWIAQAAVDSLESWTTFCRLHGARAQQIGLHAVAQRLQGADSSKAISLLGEAWKCYSEFFYEDEMSSSICACLLKLDAKKGADLMYASFRHQFQRYPGSIVYRLPKLLEFSSFLKPFDAVHLYDVWAAYNRQLALGLATKQIDLSWLREPIEEDFQRTVVQYLLRLLSYPVVDVRLLAQDELFRLSTERVDVEQLVFDMWPALKDGEREYVGALMFAHVLSDTAYAKRRANALLLLGNSSSHHGIRATISDAIVSASRGPGVVDQLVVDQAEALRRAPSVIIPRIQPIRLPAVYYSRYLDWAEEVLSRVAPPKMLEAHVRATLERNYPEAATGRDREAETHMRHNINTNFDNREISGTYEQAARASINQALHELMSNGLVDVKALGQNEDVLRVRDPSDMLWRKMPRPSEVTWIDPTLDDKAFLDHVDLEDNVLKLSGHEQRWLTVFECTEQRQGDGISSSLKYRATKARIHVFGAIIGQPIPTLEHVSREIDKGCLRRTRNLYRFELRDVPPRRTSAVLPIFQSTSRKFRGRHTPDLAAIAPDLVERYKLTPLAQDPFGWSLNGKAVVRSIEWQEAFDQGRRLDEPRSSGFLLQIDREFSEDLSRDLGVELWAHLAVRRGIDKYKPECVAEWREKRFLARLNTNSCLPTN